MNNESFLIEDTDLDIARNICKFIDNPDLRNKATANVTAAILAKKYFSDCNVDIESGLHNIYQVLEDIEISDVYINDNYIDVRLYFDDNALFVPKKHFESELLPAAYMFIKISSDLSNGVVTGFILPPAVDKSNEINGYYKVDESSLVSFYDVEANLVNKYSDDISEALETQIFDYLDGKLTDNTAFYRALLDSKEARLKLQNAAKAQVIFNFVSVPSSGETEESEEEFSSLIEETPLELQDESFDMLEPIGEEIQDISIDALETEENSIEEFSLEEADNSFSLEENNEILEIGETEELPEFNTTLDIEEFVPENNEDEFNIGELDSSTQTLEEPIDENPVGSLDIIEETQEPESIQEDEPAFENFEYSTEVTPSLDTFDEIKEKEPEQDEEIQELTEEILDQVPVQDEVIDEQETENAEQIDTLFAQENETVENIEQAAKQKPKTSPIIPILGAVVVFATVGYYSYTKFFAPQSGNELTETPPAAVQPEENNKATPVEEAMPVETVENIQLNLSTNEGNAVSIPAIEKNLDASIVVSNLAIDFLVPQGYKANKTAERYFNKMGKIIQLNLKTELLLLTKQPITNRIEVELEYNKSAQKFDVKGILASSGEKSIDDLIVQTVKNALNINLNMNMTIFGNVAGNPVLVIKL